MKIKNTIAAILFVMAAAGCGQHDTHSEADVHEEHIQLTAYNNDFELFAEAHPFTVGEPSEVLAHFTHLNNFKPLEAGKVTASLIVGNEKSVQSAEAPHHPGIYEFTFTPTVTGSGKIVFDIVQGGSSSQIVVRDVTVYANEQEAEEAAEEGEVESSNGVAFTKEMSWKTDFATEECRPAPFGQIIRTLARVEPAPEDEAIVTAKSSGIVTITKNGLAEGQTVTAGETLLYIGGGDLTDNNLSVRYREAESNYNLAKQEYERKKLLAKDRIVSQSELLKAQKDYETAEAVYNNLNKNFSAGRQAVKAAFGGFIKQLFVRNGEYVEAGHPIMMVANNRNLYLKAEIQSKYYPLLAQIETANLHRLNDDKMFTLQELNGRLVSYGKAVTTDNPLLPVLFQIENSANLLPGTFVELFIQTASTSDVLTVPNTALVEEMGSLFVYVQLTPELFEKREVTTGSTDGLRTELLSGLRAGERVVSKGAVMVKLAQATGTLDAHSGHVH